MPQKRDARAIAEELVKPKPVRCDLCRKELRFHETVVYARDSDDAYVYGEDNRYLLCVKCFNNNHDDYESIAILTFQTRGG